MSGRAPSGLYGWIRSNDGRSLGLFLAFLLAVQMLAAPTLFLPLVFLDPAHAPALDWAGYGLRYVPIVLVASVAWFGWKYWWHIETVKRAVGFRFIDNREEPYLCEVIEPLITMWGLPVPFVGVIESPARNAFACGIGRKKAVVVVTRGLIEDLEREELSCVLAHELSHIKNGDIRLMAAANIFMRALTDMQRNNPMQMTPVHVVMALAVPAMLPLTLIGNFIGRAGLRAGQMSRLLIASKREFIADAEAVQLTKNPGAMASALVKVEHRYRIQGARGEDDAMMIAGDTEGDNATHPTVAHRIAALARTTGSMVFNSPHSPRPEAFAGNPSLSEAQASALLRQLPAARTAERVLAGSRVNWLGLDSKGTIMAVIAVGGLIGLHWDELGNSRVMMAKFDARPIAAMLAPPVSCYARAMIGAPCSDADDRAPRSEEFAGQNNTLAGWLAKERAKRRKEEGVAEDAALLNLADIRPTTGEYLGQSGRLKGVKAVFADRDRQTFDQGGGRVSTKVPEALQIAEIEQVGCFPATLFYNEPQGHFRLYDEQPLGYSVHKFESNVINSAIPYGALGSKDNDDWLRSYIQTRETMTTFSFSNWGIAGFEKIREAYREPIHAAVLEKLAQRMQDPGFASGFDAMGKAKVAALLRAPDDFLPCAVLRQLPA